MSEHADDSGTTAGETLTAVLASPVVHLELHTRDLRAACAFYSQLLQWRTEQIEHSSGCYQALEVGGDLGGGVVACGNRRAVWLSYVEDGEIAAATDRVRWLGASFLTGPRWGPAWRARVGGTAEGLG